MIPAPPPGSGEELAADLRRRAASCCDLLSSATMATTRARLKGKAAAYDHAAELALARPPAQSGDTAALRSAITSAIYWLEHGDSQGLNILRLLKGALAAPPPPQDSVSEGLRELGERLARGEIIGGTPYAARMAATLLALPGQAALAAAATPSPAPSAALATIRRYLPPLDEGSKAAREVEEALGALATPSPEWRTDLDAAPTGQENPCIIAFTGGPNGPVVGEAYRRAEGDADDGWWWAGTGPGDYYTDPAEQGQHGRLTHWRAMPAPPVARTQDGGKG